MVQVKFEILEEQCKEELTKDYLLQLEHLQGMQSKKQQEMVPPIDLIDGELLCDKLKEFNLGVKTELIEEVTVNNEWYNKI